MIRHTVLFVLTDDATEDQVLRAKEGMAYCYYASEVLTLDLGEDLGLAPTRFKLALFHDHRDRAAWDKYNENDTHHRVGEWIKAMTQPGEAARVDWVYEGPESRRGAVRHTALYRWAEGIGDDRKAEVRSQLAALSSAVPSIRALMVGDDLGWYPPNYDWIVEAHFDDVDGLREFTEHPAQRAMAAVLEEASQPRGIAQFQHRMLAG
jgi:hypothetical protein